MLIRTLAACAALTLTALPAAAETEISVYGGWQTSPHSSVSGQRADGTSFRSTIGWDGKSFDMPPYYGVRAMWWQPNDIGYGIEFTHAKVYAPAGEKPVGFSRLEFTDGHNIVTANITKRWPGLWAERFSPYVGAGLGIAVPHVDVTENGNRTFGYQYTGPALRLTAGTSYNLNDRWAAFGEYQFTISNNEADLEGGGTLDTRLITNALNVGLSFRF
jgi:lipid A oxidase